MEAIESGVKQKKLIEHDNLFETIISEYDIKRNSFNPNTGSPDLFIKKLKYRMKHYYSVIYEEDI